MKRIVVAGLLAAAAGASAIAFAEKPRTAASTGPSPAAATATHWTVDYGASRLGFSGTQTGKAFEGSFGKFEATIDLDPADPSTASIDVVVDMTSARTGDRQRDAALPGSDWFKATEFPTARFSSTSVEKTGEGRYVAHGSLTMRGVSKSLDLPFSLTTAGNTAQAVGEADLMRNDWGVGQGEFVGDDWVALQVKVNVEVTATQ